MRGYARELAFCQLFGWQLSGNYETTKEEFDSDKITPDDIAFVDTIVQYAIQHNQEINETISLISHTFKVDRMYKTDITALQLAIAECRCCDTPMQVVASEIVAIVKKYSTEKSVSFVNGIMAEYIRRNS